VKSTSGSTQFGDSMQLSDHTLGAEIDPIKVLVRNEYLQNFESGHGQYTVGELCAIWSYPGHQPTFTVRLESGALFTYLPVAAFVSRPLSCHESAGDCTVYAPSNHFVLYRAKLLQTMNVLCYAADRSFLGVGEYYFSMEWPDKNDVVHLFLVKGAYHFIPQHKMLALPDPTWVIPALPSLKKIRSEWVKPVEVAQVPVSTPMLLWCPECSTRHIDEGAFAEKLHHTHACQSCGHVWRPAIAPTVGVRFLPGFKNDQ